MANFNLDIPIAGKIVDAVREMVDDRKVTAEEMERLGIEHREIDARIIESDNKVRAEEAKHPSVWVAGARLAVIWVTAFAFFYNIILHTLLEWLFVTFQAFEWIPYTVCVATDFAQQAVGECEIVQIKPPPRADTGDLITVAAGGGAMGAYRSYDKSKGRGTVRFASKRRHSAELPDIEIIDTEARQ